MTTLQLLDIGLSLYFIVQINLGLYTGIKANGFNEFRTILKSVVIQQWNVRNPLSAWNMIVNIVVVWAMFHWGLYGALFISVTLTLITYFYAFWPSNQEAIE